MSSHFWWYIARASGLVAWGLVVAACTWGIVSMYLLVAIKGTSLARARLSPKVWRGIHVLSHVLLAMVTIHLLTAGTDANVLLSRSPRRS